MENILDQNLEELQNWMEKNSEKKFRAKQVFDWVYDGIYDFDSMGNLPQGLKSKLASYFYIDIPEIVEAYKSEIDGTVKLLNRFRDGNIIESVIMKYKYGNTICISSQVGCRMGCKFCASTLNGIVRNLSAGEIISEIIAGGAYISERISNVVIMGSGEPLDNYNNIIKFLELVNLEHGLNIGQRHITLSTCGLVPKIYDLANKKLQITLAISLHSSNDEERRKIMPIANKYSIVDIMEACKYYIDMTGRRITFEYALIHGENDAKEDAYELVGILRGMLCHVNLIPMNEVKESKLKKSTNQNVKTFRDILDSSGIEVTIRRELGADINAACGQLRKSYLESHD
ncbi:MAG: 23S rRNA (adenine(2503)-C(2))-methyltransferase RlmN [Bacillota bacterium]|nr:23S rRNA (adenine(2503)-C(2))-methyltransferase RlmN [Bacillota bacterium]